jgi:hypothetical protein
MHRSTKLAEARRVHESVVNATNGRRFHEPPMGRVAETMSGLLNALPV